MFHGTCLKKYIDTINKAVCAHTFYWVVFLFAWAKCIKMLNFIMFLNALVWIELNPFPMFLSLFYLNSYECFPCQKHYNTTSNFHRSIISQYISKCNLLVVKIYYYAFLSMNKNTIFYIHAVLLSIQSIVLLLYQWLYCSI